MYKTRLILCLMIACHSHANAAPDAQLTEVELKEMEPREVTNNFIPVGFDQSKHFAYWETYYLEAAGCHQWEFNVLNIKRNQVVKRIATSNDDCYPELSVAALKARLESQSRAIIKHYGIDDQTTLTVQPFPFNDTGRTITASLSPAAKAYQEDVVMITPVAIKLTTNQGPPQTISVFREVTFGSIKQTHSPQVAGYITNARNDRLIIVGTHTVAGHHGPPDATRIWLRGAFIHP